MKNGDAAMAATVAQRMALHEMGRLRGDEVEGWSRRAIAMARPGDPVREEAEALLGLGIAWQGRIDEGIATYDVMLSRINPTGDGPQLARIQIDDETELVGRLSPGEQRLNSARLLPARRKCAPRQSHLRALRPERR